MTVGFLSHAYLLLLILLLLTRFMVLQLYPVICNFSSESDTLQIFGYWRYTKRGNIKWLGKKSLTSDFIMLIWGVIQGCGQYYVRDGIVALG